MVWLLARPRPPAAVFALFGLCWCAPETPASDAAEPFPSPSPSPPPPPSSGAESSLPTVSAKRLHRHIERLSHPDMAGRAPGTAATPQYIAAQMQEMGLAPAGDDGFFQVVPLRGSSLTRPRFELRDDRSERTLALGPNDVVANAMGPAGEHRTTVPIVFAGYGIDAPEEQWNDYASLDVRGALVVVLAGDPPAKPERFDGATLSAYGRWDTKFATALAHGAWGCFVVHDPRTAGYGWPVVDASWNTERFTLRDDPPAALELQGFLARAAGIRLATLAGASLEDWHAASRTPGGASTRLPVRLGASFDVVVRDVEDRNVIGRFQNGEALAPTVVVTAHWDHLGERVSDSGERIVFPGALDNATGVAGLLEIARTTTAAPHATAVTSVLFLATAAEEQGLLGSRHFARQHSPASVAAVINLESLSLTAPQSLEYVVSRDGGAALGAAFVRAVRAQGREVTPLAPDPSGAYFRADHFSFATKGIVALTFWPAPDSTRPGGRSIATSRAARYHSTLDRYDPTWSLAGARADCDAVLWVLRHWG